MTASREQELVGYLFGDGAETDATRIEDAMFGDATVGAQMKALLALRGSIRSLRAHEGSLSLSATRAALQALEAKGKRVQWVEMRPDATTGVDIAEGTEILVAVLPMDLSGVKRIDVSLHEADGESRHVAAEDSPFDPADGAVLVPCDVNIARASLATLFRVVSHRADGTTRQHDFLGTIP